MTSEIGKLQSKLIKITDKTILNYCFGGKKPVSEAFVPKIEEPVEKVVKKEPKRRSPLYEAPVKKEDDPNNRPPS